MLDSMEDETQMSDDYTQVQLEYLAPPARAKECNTFKWQVELIDDAGNTESKMVTSKDVWKLQNSKVIVHFDGDSGQPYGDSAGLLGSWLGQLSNDVQLLPINYNDWRNVAPHVKENAWKVIKSKFWFDDPEVREKYVMSALGSRCKDVKLRLWKEYKKPDKAATEQNRPKDVPADQWKHLVHMRFAEKWKDALTAILSQNAGTQVLTNAPARLNDEYAQVFGPDPSGRVRCVGRGPTPSKIPRLSRPCMEDITNSETVVELKKQNKSLGATVKALNTIVQELLSSSGDKGDALSAKLAEILADIPSASSSQDTSQSRSDHVTADDDQLEDP